MSIKSQPVDFFFLLLQVAIPIVPTIRVLVKFMKFEELQPMEEFSTPLSSPAHFQDARSIRNQRDHRHHGFHGLEIVVVVSQATSRKV